MCGLVGFIRRSGSKDAAEFLVEGLWAGSLRGMDATGIAYGDIKDGKLVPSGIFKKPVSGPDLLQFRGFGGIMSTHPDWVIGHNRAGTNGGNFERNAHPFHEDHIILAHNGHIYNQDSLPKGPPLSDPMIDSNKLTYSMAKSSELEVLNAARGNFALTWLNILTGKFNMATNGTKPLYFAFEKKIDGLYWASEIEMLEWLMERNGIAIDGDILFPEPFHWYKFDAADLRKYEQEKFEEPPKVVAMTAHKTACASPAVETQLIKPLGKKKQDKLLANHGLSIGAIIPVLLEGYSCIGYETIATYTLGDKTLRKFKGAVQQNRSLLDLRKQAQLPVEEKMESGIVIGVAGNQGKLQLIISPKMDTSWADDVQLPTSETDDSLQDFPGMARGPGGVLIPIQRFLELTAEGCAKCGRILAPTTPVVWDEIAKGQYIVWCAACASTHRTEVA